MPSVRPRTASADETASEQAIYIPAYRAILPIVDPAGLPGTCIVRPTIPACKDIQT